ncbi:hypothetical protein VNO78_18237 [Psophocarpus tetragonolobus]|uniref:Uncharacterized protein n=1 Tax=Psophocarpus tetragonolobus TaxID=3891 RepID=A0AAN9SIZ2_PSOTE
MSRPMRTLNLSFQTRAFCWVHISLCLKDFFNFSMGDMSCQATFSFCLKFERFAPNKTSCRQPLRTLIPLELLAE